MVSCFWLFFRFRVVCFFGVVRWWIKMLGNWECNLVGKLSGDWVVMIMDNFSLCFLCRIWKILLWVRVVLLFGK